MSLLKFSGYRYRGQEKPALDAVGMGVDALRSEQEEFLADWREWVEACRV